MSSCVLNILTMLLVPVVFILSVYVGLAIREYFNAFVKDFPFQVLVPVVATALVIFMIRVETPKYVQIVDCGTGNSINVSCLCGIK